MEKRFQSLLHGLIDTTPRAGQDVDLVIEARAISVIASVSHLIDLIESHYDEEQANDLTKRLFNAARSGDEEKFRRKIRAIRESKKRTVRHEKH